MIVKFMINGMCVIHPTCFKLCSFTDALKTGSLQLDMFQIHPSFVSCVLQLFKLSQ